MDRTWGISQTPEFKSSLPFGDAPLMEALRRAQLRVQANPLIGDPKTGRYRGYRSIHVKDHWVLAWKLVPPIFHASNLPKLELVVFAFFGHHDAWA